MRGRNFFIYRQGKQYVIDIIDLLGQACGLRRDFPLVASLSPLLHQTLTSIYQSMQFTKPQT